LNPRHDWVSSIGARFVAWNLCWIRRPTSCRWHPSKTSVNDGRTRRPIQDTGQAQWAVRPDRVQPAGPTLSRPQLASRHARRRLVQAASRSACCAVSTIEARRGSLASTRQHRTGAVLRAAKQLARGRRLGVPDLRSPEILVARQCADEREARYVAEAAKKDLLRTGWTA
jgi:hypothetical protein